MDLTIGRSEGNNLVHFEYVEGDGVVYGVVGTGKDSFAIYEWTSRKGDGQHGLTERAIRALKKRLGGHVVVIDAGYEGDPSFSYWTHLFDKGLVDEVFDDDGLRVRG